MKSHFAVSHVHPREGASRCLAEPEAAKYLQISASSLRKGRMNGALEGRMPVPPFVRLGRRIVYLRDDLDRWLESHRITDRGAGAK